MSARLAKSPFVLLGLLTLLTVVGPLLISNTIRGGANPRWPPDRPVEWWTFGIVIATFVVLMGTCLAIGVVDWRRTLKARPAPSPKDPPK
jgi:hypothetical protein